MMRALGLVAALLVAQTAWAADRIYPDVADSSGAEAGGRLLQDSIVVNVPSEKVWAAFVDPQTIMGWSAPMAVVELRQGGFIEEGFTKEAKLGSADNIRHRI